MTIGYFDKFTKEYIDEMVSKYGDNWDGMETKLNSDVMKDVFKVGFVYLEFYDEFMARLKYMRHDAFLRTEYKTWDKLTIEEIYEILNDYCTGGKYAHSIDLNWSFNYSPF